MQSHKLCHQETVTSFTTVTLPTTLEVSNRCSLSFRPSSLHSRPVPKHLLDCVLALQVRWRFLYFLINGITQYILSYVRFLSLSTIISRCIRVVGGVPRCGHITVYLLTCEQAPGRLPVWGHCRCSCQDLWSLYGPTFSLLLGKSLGVEGLGCMLDTRLVF